MTRQHSMLSIFTFALVCALSVGILDSQAKQPDSKHAKREDTAFALQYQALLETSVQLTASKIDARISLLKHIAESTANDPFIHDWLAKGSPAAEQSLLLEKLQFLVNNNQLTSASFADKATNGYWNHEGFLRVLQPETDTWYFAYLESGQQDLVSVYHDKNKKRVDLYVNYQQIDGDGLSGIATSFDSILGLLKTTLPQSLQSNMANAAQPKVVLVDGEGIVQVAASYESLQGAHVSSVVPSQTLSALMNQNDINRAITADNNALYLSSYLPNMQWYLMVVIEH
ncbi:chemotaxis protein [Ningiella sp. W23]|uniref:chemotaxis protein n=1 Tax=Ningiella sp. W23 TaxID=3023715 RepID=UPI00375662B7